MADNKLNDEIAEEIRNERKRKETLASAVKPDGYQLTGAKIAWMLGAFLIDASTAYAIWQVLFWWYGALWILAGAGGIAYSDWLHERAGNNDLQNEIADTGLKLSWVSLVLMAILSGLTLALGIEKNQYIEGFMLLFVVGLFVYHVFQSYRYSINDDGYKARTARKKAFDEVKKRIDEIHNAGIILDERKRVERLLSQYANEHGAALFAQLGEKPRAFAQETEEQTLQTGNPTNAGQNKRPPN